MGEMAREARENAAGQEAVPEPVPGRRYDHQRMDVYRAGVAFLEWRRGALRSLPKGSDLADQLTRASTSITLNIAEGCGEYSRGERLRFFRMARRSATECDAILDAALALGLESPAMIATGRAVLHRVLAMLTVLVRRSG